MAGNGRQGFRAPLFPPGFPSLTHSPDSFVQQNYIQPELLLAAMAAQSTAQNGYNECSSLRSYVNPLSTPFICPKCAFSLSSNFQFMNTISSGNFQSPSFKRTSFQSPLGSVPMQGGRKPRFSNQTSNFCSSSPPWPNFFPMQRQMQKTRKPYYMPYCSEETVIRGLKNGDFIKGILRVSQSNNEEAYIDNPDGNDHHDIMIIKDYDRNRAVHGDEVVVRLKERGHWVVCEALYQSWRSGELDILFDENGQPITVPPVKDAREEILTFLPIGLRKLVDLDKVTEFILIDEKACYTVKCLLHIGVQVEYARRADTNVFNLPLETLELIKALSIGREISAKSSQTELTNNASGSSNRCQSIGVGYRLLSEMPDEDWGIPDVCLQKTAEVVYIWKTEKDSNK